MSTLKNALARAIDAIILLQDSCGSWRDFDLPIVGESDTWVTAHVGYRLANLPRSLRVPKVRKALQAAAEYIQESWRWGWGYNNGTPIDSDSTAHAVLFLRTIGVTTPPNLSKFFMQFRQADGGFCTFLRAPGVPAEHSWYIAHPDVTALVIRSLALDDPLNLDLSMVDAACKSLEQHRLPDGSYAAFWWNLHFYTLAVWCETLSCLNRKLPALAHSFWGIPSLIQLSPLDQAHYINYCCCVGELETARLLARNLLAIQHSSGLWQSYPILRTTNAETPLPWAVHNAGRIDSDIRSIYSTSTILNSLSKLWDMSR